MSYILDALKRAEQQRGGAARAAGRAPRSIPADTASRGPWPWIAAGGVALGVLVAAIALWPATTPPPAVVSAPSEVAAVATRTAPQDAVQRPGVAVPETVAPPSPPATKPAAPIVSAPAAPSAPARSDHRVAGRAASPPAMDRSVASRATVPPALDRDAGGKPITPPVVRAAPPAAAPPVVHSAPRPAAPPPVERSTPRPDATPPALRAAPKAEDTPPVARPTLRTDVRVASPPAPDVPHPAPRASAPAAAPPAGGGGEAKALAAKVSLQVLSWAPEPKDRFVFLNGRRYGEGQLVDDKLLVERITEDGVVLSFQGERVTLRGR